MLANKVQMILIKQWITIKGFTVSKYVLKYKKNGFQES